MNVSIANNGDVRHADVIIATLLTPTDTWNFVPQTQFELISQPPEIEFLPPEGEVLNYPGRT